MAFSTCFNVAANPTRVDNSRQAVQLSSTGRRLSVTTSRTRQKITTRSLTLTVRSALQVCIMTPESNVFNDEAKEVILPTTTGQMGVLPQHSSLISGLDIGVVLVNTMKDGWMRVSVMGGFALVKEDDITILVNGAELGSEIVDAEGALGEAKKAMDKASTPVEQMETQLAYKRAKANFDASSTKTDSALA